MEATAAIALAWIGIAVLVVAGVVSNFALFKLNKEVNKAYDIRNRISPWDMAFPSRPSMKEVRERVRLYRAAYGDGPQWRRLKSAYWLVGVGATLVISSSLWRWLSGL
jgi:hypothetical protein